MNARAIFLTVTFFIFSLSCPAAYAYSTSFIGDISVSYLDGDVQMKAEDVSEWVPASINMPLMEGDSIWVPEGGRLGIQLRNGSFLRLNENTGMDVLSVTGESYQFYVSTGNVYINFTGRGNTFLQVDTPMSSVRVSDPAKFRVDIFGDGYTDISVLKGVAYAEGSGGKTTVTSGNVLSLSEGAYAELAPLGPVDDWERWNRDMDARVERVYGSRYLPAELSAYAYDLDESGKWIYVRDYGHCWTPRTVAPGWAPYKFGRWTWIGRDYVWVSYDPWGWAPYHYGRWAFDRSAGWCWVPPAAGAVYWGPGFVGWVNTPNYVAWVPLAPGEVYYGYGNYGPHSVNLVNINIGSIHVTKAYRNVHARNSVTVVGHKTFVTGRPSTVTAGENPFLLHRPSIGRPDIRPVRSSYMPVLKSIPTAKVPPPAIRHVRVRELKEKRPVVKNLSHSVLKRGRTVNPLTVRSVREARVPGVTVQPGTVQRRTIREKEKSGIPRKEVQKPGGEVRQDLGGEGAPAELQGSGGIFRQGKKPAVIRKEVQKPGSVIRQEHSGESARGEKQGAGGLSRREKKPAVVHKEMQKPGGEVRQDLGGEGAPAELQGSGGIFRQGKKPAVIRKEVQKPGGAISQERKPEGTRSDTVRKPAVIKQKGKDEQQKTKGTHKDQSEKKDEQNVVK